MHMHLILEGWMGVFGLTLISLGKSSFIMYTIAHCLLSNIPFFIWELLSSSSITVDIVVQFMDLGLINHLVHIDGGELSLIKVRFKFYPSDTQWVI